MAGARLVVSDSGESLSPKYAPAKIAPAVGPRGIPIPVAMPMRASPMVPMVPHDEPVASDVIEHIRTAAIRNIEGDKSLSP